MAPGWQFWMVILIDMMSRFGISKFDLMIFAKIESGDCHRLRCRPVAVGEIALSPLTIQSAYADEFVLFRDFVREIIKRALVEAIQVRIPRLTRLHVVAAIAGVGKHFIARVLDGD